MNYGLIKVAAATPQTAVADCEANRRHIESMIAQAEGMGAEIIVFPELSITGYSCQDLFHQQLLLDEAERNILMLLDFTRKLDIISIVGAPVPCGPLLLNAAVVIQQGQILGIVPKTFLPNYGEFYEKRWFAPAEQLHTATIRYAAQNVEITSQPQLFVTQDGCRFGIEICEDVWAPEPPSDRLALLGADIVFNLSASDELTGKLAYLRQMLAQQSARSIGGYVYSSCGFGESSQDLVYGGHTMVFENGKLLASGPRFSIEGSLITAQIDVESLRWERRRNGTFGTAQGLVAADGYRMVNCRQAENSREFHLDRPVSPTPFIPASGDMDANSEEILSIQSAGLAKRVLHTHAKTVVIGISGGLDSTLALLVAVRTFDMLKRDRKGIVGVTMPGFGTTGRTHNNAVEMMTELGITQREVSIAKAVSQHFSDIGHDPEVHDTTYENSQARERTQILMDLSNELGGFVVGTGDLSELALGWCTYNGDHMSMYGVNVGVPKTLVKFLVGYEAKRLGGEISRVLGDIIDTPISPELTPADAEGNIAQKTEDLIGPYELHDFFIFYSLRHGFSPSKIYMFAQKAFNGRYSNSTILHWLRNFYWRFFSQQFKRSCLPDGPKVGSVSLSPRGDWRMASDSVATAWLNEVDMLKP